MSPRIYDTLHYRQEGIIHRVALKELVWQRRAWMLFGEAREVVGSESAGEALVEANNLEKIYAAGGARVHALREVDLSILRGEMVAVMGPSGCGKTKLLNCLSGLDEFDRGEVLIGGESISGMSDRKRTRFRAERMGFVFQTYNLIPVLSAVENVELSLLVAGTKPKEARRRAISVLEMVGLADQANKRPNGMSGGHWTSRCQAATG
jgi:ABC-type lipoprotein export system ATPase subunit